MRVHMLGVVLEKRSSEKSPSCMRTASLSLPTKTMVTNLIMPPPGDLNESFSVNLAGGFCNWEVVVTF